MLRVRTVDRCSLAFHRRRKHTLPMGTACTGPESPEISVAIGLAFLPAKLPRHKHAANTLIIGSGNTEEREREREIYQWESVPCAMVNHGRRDMGIKWKMVREKEI